MLFTSLPGLVRRAVPVRWRRAPRRRPRHVLRLEPLEDRALLATLTVPVPDPAVLPPGAVTVWVRELVEGRYDTITLTSLDADGLRRLLADLAAMPGVPFEITREFLPSVPPPVMSPPPPPPPQSPPGGADTPAPDTPVAKPTLAPTPVLRGGLTLTLFRPPPTTPPGPSADPSRPADSPAEVAPIPVGTLRPAAPPEWAPGGGAAGTPAITRPPTYPGGPAPVSEVGPVRFAGKPSSQAETSRPAAVEVGWDDARPLRTESAGRGASAVGVAGEAAAPPDDALLRRYAAGGDQPAFAEIVRRHEAAVLRVSARVVGDADLARDAAQAAFLALARRAGELDGRGSLAGWLYRVAYRMALRLRRAAARRWRAERVALDRPPPADADPAAEADRADVLRVLHEELFRLPDRFRVPLVLCYLDGRTHEEVARAAGLPRGSVAKRVAEGLGRLRERLAYRGVVL